jgi:beta-fructofuranosidase
LNIIKQFILGLTIVLFLLCSGTYAADYADGKISKALILGGNSFTVKIPHYAGLKPAKAITISAWIKPERVGKGGWQWQEIYRKEDGNARVLMAIGEREKKHSLCFGLGIGGKYVGHGVPLEPSKLLDGKWHLVSVTFDGKAMKFYADGQEIGASTKASGAIDTQGEAPAYIGSMKGHGEFFKGGIDDVRLYNRALSTGEIKTMALADGKTAVNGIVGWWKLDGDLKNSAAEAPKKLLAELDGIHTPVMPKSLPSSWLTYHLAHPGPDNARPADPNCAIYYGGLYHLHYIYQNRGHSFAHVTSKDMVHWEWQPSVLTPPATGHGMYSGTAFLTREGKPAIIYHGQGSKRNQIAFAQDASLNRWSKPFPVEPKTADGKPAEKMRHWDPDCWVMNDTYYALGGGQNPTLAKSKDLKTWEFLGELLHPDFPKDLGVPKGEDISCANLFKIGDKWMLLCISHKLGARYYLGDFKDEKFLPDHHAMMNWWGWDFFAPESLLTPDGRRVTWSWCTPPIKAWGQKGKVSDLASLMEGDKKIQPGIQSLPRELSLPEDGVLRIKPLRELETLRSNKKQEKDNVIKSNTAHTVKKMAGDTLELEVTFSNPTANEFGVKVLCAKDGSGGFTIASGKASKVLTVGYIKPPFELKKGEDLTLRIFIDKSMIEVFANDRQAAVAWHEYDPKDISVSLFSQGGDLKVKSITSWKMNSIYTTRE